MLLLSKIGPIGTTTSISAVLHKKNKRTFLLYLFVSTFFPVLIIGTFYLLTFRLQYNLVFQHLEDISQNKELHIQTYFSMLKNRILGTASDGKINDCTYFISEKLPGCTPTELTNHLRNNKLPAVRNLVEINILDTK